MHSIVRREQTLDLFNRSIVIDLDDTISLADKSIHDVYEKYMSAEPNLPIIEGMRKLHKEGWYITIHTARHMLTCYNDPDEAFARLGQLTADWLDAYKVPFDQLIFGKPYGVAYIDDKAMSLHEFITFSA
jgi:capsule biosynthesis phosphatase